ncbi:MAG: hypothetical protein AAGJ46_16965 [Planctomycetota bacterium]
MKTPVALTAVFAFLCVGCTSKPAPDQAEAAAESSAPPATRRDAALASAPTPDEPIDREVVFPTFGVALTPPEGWQAESAQPPAGFLGRWLPADAAADDWSQFSLDLRVGAGDGVASRFAEILEGRGYKRSNARMAGGSALRLDAPPTDPGVGSDAESNDAPPTPSPVFLVGRGESLWRLLFLLPTGADTAVAEDVAASVRWLPAEPIENHLKLGAAQVVHGCGTIRTPSISRTDPSFAQEGAEAFTAFDYRAGQDGLIMAFYRRPARENDSLGAQAAVYAEHVEERTGIEGVLRFRVTENNPDVMMSDPLVGEFPSGDKTVTRQSVYAVWRAQNDMFIRCQAVVNDEVFSNQEAVARALDMVRRCFETCSRTGAYERPAK